MRSDKYLISLLFTSSLFMFWYEEFLFNTLTILLIVYIWGSRNTCVWISYQKYKRTWNTCWGAAWFTIITQRLQIREFASAVTENIFDLQGRTWRSKFLRMQVLVRWGRLMIGRSIWWNFFLYFVQVIENKNYKITVSFFLNIYEVTIFTIEKLV